MKVGSVFIGCKRANQRKSSRPKKWHLRRTRSTVIHLQHNGPVMWSTWGKRQIAAAFCDGRPTWKNSINICSCSICQPPFLLEDWAHVRKGRASMSSGALEITNEGFLWLFRCLSKVRIYEQEELVCSTAIKMNSAIVIKWPPLLHRVRTDWLVWLLKFRRIKVIHVYLHPPMLYVDFSWERT